MLDGINILVAEDNVVNQMIINFFLKKQRAVVKTAHNGKEAIELLSQQPYDVILMDLQMPGMDGFAAARYIRDTMKSDIPIIALTADMYATETDKCIDAGMNGYICKPYEPAQLCEMILSLTKHKHTITL